MTDAAIAVPNLTSLRAGVSDGQPWLLMDARGHCIHGWLAVGVKRSLTMRAPLVGGFDALEKFIARSEGRTFGWISYEQGWSEGCRQPGGAVETGELPKAAVVLPAIHWFEPKVLLKFDGVGTTAEIEVLAGGDHPFAASAEAAIRHPIQASDTGKTVEKLHVNATLDQPLYGQAFDEVQSHIQRGDVYELNLCTSQSGTADIDEGGAFAAIVEATRPPHAAWCSHNNKAILCASPERFLSRSANRLLSSPIKGTAPRGADEAQDCEAIERLKSDPKERAENVMITDLVRNDMSRVALAKSVAVTELCGIRSFKNVHQMISTVECEVEQGTGMAQILRATFPMGSMTGAPKERAMELISTYEKTQRGLYSGALGWADPKGDFDLAVVIRTALIDHNSRRFSVQSGGAITTNSQRESEWEECLLKARTLLGGLAQNTTMERNRNA
ncbi:MAG: anthranilate synthase component I family protein [Flavobacteriales bacterium]|nr:anthranilate synthase component I family protein [Flavobacteriales bacterium]